MLTTTTTRAERAKSVFEKLRRGEKNCSSPYIWGACLDEKKSSSSTTRNMKAFGKQNEKRKIVFFLVFSSLWEIYTSSPSMSTLSRWLILRQKMWLARGSHINRGINFTSKYLARMGMLQRPKSAQNQLESSEEWSTWWCLLRDLFQWDNRFSKPWAFSETKVSKREIFRETNLQSLNFSITAKNFQMSSFLLQAFWNILYAYHSTWLQVFKSTSLQIDKSSSLKLFKATSLQVYMSSSLQVFKSSSLHSLVLFVTSSLFSQPSTWSP